MKILVITDLYPIKSEEKKTPRTIYDFVKGWQNKGNEVLVIKPNFLFNSCIRNKPFYQSGMYENIENVNFWLPFCWNIQNKINKFNPSFLDYKPDVIIAHMPSGLIVANKLLESKNISIPLVAGVHVSDLEVLTNPLYSIYFKRELENAYKNAYKIACRSEVLRKKFLNIYPKYANKTFVAFSGINENIITKRIWKKKERYKVLTCANLIKRKNVDKLILACEKFDNIDLTIIGDGKELNNLKKLSNKPNFKRHLPHSQVLEEMRQADIFVLPSVNETFGMVYLEAMASGCITVGVKNDGIDGIIKDGYNGYLTEPDIKTIEKTLEYILNNNQEKIVENTYSTIQNHTQENACYNYLNNIKSTS